MILPWELFLDKKPPTDTQQEQPFPTQHESDNKSSTTSRDKILPPTNIVDNILLLSKPFINMDNNNPNVLQIYCQNFNGIFDLEGIKLHKALHTMHSTGDSIFIFNEISRQRPQTPNKKLPT